jgi:pimeloyl-ACP methyl ester carboxylesterase
MVGLEAAALMRSPVWRGTGLAPGDGRPVLLIPGFLAGDGSLAIMTRWLRGIGYRTHRAGIRANVDCSMTVVRALEDRLEQMAEKTGERVSIVGQSRGGIIARVLAVRRPDVVGGIVTLGSPTCGMLNVHPLVLGSIGVVGALGTLRVPHLFTLKCLRGECCNEFRAALHAAFPEDVAFTSVYSRRDGIVSWKACLDPAAGETVEVRSSHCGMAVHPDVYGVVGRALAGFAAADDAPVWTEWAQAA